MHEFSLAAEIIEIVDQTLQQHNKEKATRVVIEIGQISGVEIPALDTALEALAAETNCSGTKFEKKIVPGLARCNDCLTEFNLTDIFTLCPACQSYNKSILSGKEFNVLSIEAE